MRIKDDSFVLQRSRRRRLLKTARRTPDAALRTRYMIVLHTAQGKSQRQITAMLGTSVATVKRTRTRWREGGEAALIDRREDNGPPPKADDAFAADLMGVLRDTPLEHGHRRPTWTLELLIGVMHARGHARISRTTLMPAAASAGRATGHGSADGGLPVEQTG